MSERKRRKHPSDPMSALAGKVLAGYKPTPEEVLSLAACVLSLDVTAGANKGEPEP
jgi:hypothetical protein